MHDSFNGSRPDDSVDPPIPPRLPRILRASPHWVVVDKPVGMLSVPGRAPQHRWSVALWAAREFPNASGPISVHRLDMETSGLLLLALDAPTHAALSRQFESRTTEKTYIAILDTRPDAPPLADEGEVNLPIAPDWPNRPRQLICHTTGRPARTLYRVLHRAPAVARVEFRPITGRTHQLRLHAATPAEQGGMGAPIQGDRLYNPAPTTPRLMLHAATLAFTDPPTGERIHAQSDPGF